MALTFVYLIFRQILALPALSGRSASALAAEILLLRLENAFLHRQLNVRAGRGRTGR